MVSPDKCVYMPLILVLLLLTVSDMFRNINANLVQLKSLVTSQIREAKSAREEAKSLRADLSSLNDSVSNLSMCLQEHKQQTAAELAQLQTSLNTTSYTINWTHSTPNWRLSIQLSPNTSNRQQLS